RPPAASVPGGDGGGRLVVRDNLGHTTDIERYYRAGLRSARHDVLIANAYFFPGYRLLRDLVNAARRGVRVRLLLQGEPDVLVARLAASMLYDHLMSAGVEIFEYCKRPLHGKVACVDDDWCTVGSSNLDPLSLALNLEANVVARDTSLNRALRDSLDRLIEQDCKPVPKSPRPTRTLRRFWVGVVVFHFLRRFPAWAGALPAHKPKLQTIKPAASGEGEAA
ncbi:cardiolipin synthase ClsB, partial [Achromobacter sp. Bel]|uniref:cardiolipin synthase ClsB n=1 Tax=Achromobacter sp. Bel TaxID=2727415 RepID=UPI0020070BE8